MDEELKLGTQIVYVPNHANGDTEHGDSQPGFVTSVRGDTVFCRYWSKYEPGELRTRANSEGADRCNIVVKDTVAQYRVDSMVLLLTSEGQIIQKEEERLWNIQHNDGT